MTVFPQSGTTRLFLYSAALGLGVLIMTLGSNVGLGALFIGSSLIGLISTFGRGKPWPSVVVGVVVILALPALGVVFLVRAFQDDPVYVLPALILFAVFGVLSCLVYQRFPRRSAPDVYRQGPGRR